MNGPDHQLDDDRTRRNSARGRFEAGLAQVRADLAARGLGGRAKAEAARQARGALDQGLAIAKESKGIIAGTVAALGLWFLREPIGRAAGRLFNRKRRPSEVQDDQSSD